MPRKPQGKLVGLFVGLTKKEAGDWANAERGPGLTVRTFRRTVRADRVSVPVWVVTVRTALPKDGSGE